MGYCCAHCCCRPPPSPPSSSAPPTPPPPPLLAGGGSALRSTSSSTHTAGSPSSGHAIVAATEPSVVSAPNGAAIDSLASASGKAASIAARAAPSDRCSPSFLSQMHEKRGNFFIFLLKIAEKEGKTDLTSSETPPRSRSAAAHGLASAAAAAAGWLGAVVSSAGSPPLRCTARARV